MRALPYKSHEGGVRELYSTRQVQQHGEELEKVSGIVEGFLFLF